MTVISQKARSIARDCESIADAVEGLYREIEYRDHMIRRLIAQIDRQKADAALVRQVESFERATERDEFAERLPA